MKRHKIFKSGVHKNSVGEKVWPPEKVKGIVDATSRLSPDRIPYTIVHPKNNLPILGFAKKSSLAMIEDGGETYLEIEPAEFAEGFIPGFRKIGFDKVSIGLGQDGQIVHIGLTDSPAVDGLGAMFSAAPATNEADEVIFEAAALGFSGEIANWQWNINDRFGYIKVALRALKNMIIGDKGQEKADAILPEYIVEGAAQEINFEPPVKDVTVSQGFSASGVADSGQEGSLPDPDPAAPAPAPEHEPTKVVTIDEFEAASKRYDDLKRKNEENEARLAEYDQQQTIARFSRILDENAERVPPSMRDSVLAMMLDLHKVQPAQFSADGSVEDNESGLAKLIGIIRNKQIEFKLGEVATPDAVGFSRTESLEDRVIAALRKQRESL